MTGWSALAAELDRWERPPTLWWRDDDAVRASPALDRLLSCTAAAEIPIALAVIPALAEEGLARRIEEVAGLAVFQHGFAHRNHAPPEDKKIELGARPTETVLDELTAGRARLDALFGPRALPVLVPPWNRVAAAVADRLADIGFRGLSAKGPRGAPRPGLVEANVHADLIDWRGSRGFAGEAAVLAQLVGHLAARRDGRADPAEPTGLMTHHLDHDAGCWDFLDAFTAFLLRRGGVRWLPPAAVFAAGRPLDSPAGLR